MKNIIGAILIMALGWHAMAGLATQIGGWMDIYTGSNLGGLMAATFWAMVWVVSTVLKEERLKALIEYKRKNGIELDAKEKKFLQVAA